jgi:hypothetical protein
MRTILALLAVAMPWMPGVAPGMVTDTAWRCDPATQGPWHDSDNWTAGVPSDAVSAKIDNGGTAVISAEAEVRYLYVGDSDRGTIRHPSGRLSPVWEVHLGYGADSYGRYELSGTATIAHYYQDLYVGTSGRGEFVQTGQSVCSMGDVVLGEREGSHGTYELTDASLQAQQVFIGRDGAGVFTQHSGTVRVTRHGQLRHVTRQQRLLGRRRDL